MAIHLSNSKTLDQISDISLEELENKLNLLNKSLDELDDKKNKKTMINFLAGDVTLGEYLGEKTGLNKLKSSPDKESKFKKIKDASGFTKFSENLGEYSDKGLIGFIRDKRLMKDRKKLEEEKKALENEYEKLSVSISNNSSIIPLNEETVYDLKTVNTIIGNEDSKVNTKIPEIPDNLLTKNDIKSLINASEKTSEALYSISKEIKSIREGMIDEQDTSIDFNKKEYNKTSGADKDSILARAAADKSRIEKNDYTDSEGGWLEGIIGGAGAAWLCKKFPAQCKKFGKFAGIDYDKVNKSGNSKTGGLGSKFKSGDVDVDGKPGKSSWFDKVKEKVSKNKKVLGAASLVGAGSWFGSDIAERVSKMSGTSGVYDESDGATKFSKNGLGSTSTVSTMGTSSASSTANGDLGQGTFETTGKNANIMSMLDDVAARTGVEPNTLKTFAAIESNFNPNAKASTSSATGLFQFLKSTWKDMTQKYGAKYGISPSTSPLNPEANALMGAEFLKENTKIIQSVKPNVTTTDLYLAHFLGPGGAKTFLKADPSTIGAELMPAPAKANRNIFFKGGDKSKPRTVGEIYEHFKNLVAKKAAGAGFKASKSSGQPNVKGTPEVSTKAPGTVKIDDSGTSMSPENISNNQSTLSKVGSGTLKGLGVAATGYEVYTGVEEYNEAKTGSERQDAVLGTTGSIAGGFVGGTMGAQTGALVGTVAGPVGAVVGGVVGGIGGSILGSIIGEEGLKRLGNSFKDGGDFINDELKDKAPVEKINWLKSDVLPKLQEIGDTESIEKINTYIDKTLIPEQAKYEASERQRLMTGTGTKETALVGSSEDTYMDYNKFKNDFSYLTKDAQQQTIKDAQSRGDTEMIQYAKQFRQEIKTQQEQIKGTPEVLPNQIPNINGIVNTNELLIDKKGSESSNISINNTTKSLAEKTTTTNESQKGNINVINNNSTTQKVNTEQVVSLKDFDKKELEPLLGFIVSSR